MFLCVRACVVRAGGRPCLRVDVFACLRECACAYVNVFLHVVLRYFLSPLSLLIRFAADSYEESGLSGVERHLTAQILCPAGKEEDTQNNTPERKELQVVSYLCKIGVLVW